jgi:hypothetical protein
LTKMACLFASFTILASCATHSAPLADRPATKAPTPQACIAPVAEPKYPEAASVVKPVTPEEREATQELFLWVAQVLDWGRQGWSEYQLASKAACKH